MRNKLLALLLFASPCFAQAPLNLETTANGITQNWAAGGNVTRGQIVKFSGSQVVAVATADTSGAIGVAITSGSQGQSVLISVMGSPLIQVDGACTQGNSVIISPSNTGFGRCTASPTGQTIGTALNTIGAAGFVGVQLSPLSSASAGGGSVTQASIPGSPGINSSPISSGLMAEYRLLPTETPSACVDYSGNGRNCTGTVGTAPTIIAGSGGILVNGNGALSLPASLNSALSYSFYACFQNPASSTAANWIIASSSGQTGLEVVTNNPAINTLFGGSRLATIANNAIKTQTNWPFNGCGTITETMDTTDHIYWNGQETTLYASTGTSAGVAAGNYQLGGIAGTYWQGQIYYAVFYNRVLTQTEALSIANWLNIYIPNRGGIAPFVGLVSANDMILSAGDSETEGFGLTTRWQSQVVLNSALGWSTVTEPVANNGQPSKLLNAMAADANYEIWPMYRIKNPAPGISGQGGRNVVIAWGGTNDCNAANSAAQIEQHLFAFSGSVKQAPWSNPTLVFTSMMDRSGLSTCKNNWNTLLRLNAPGAGVDYLVDMASNPLLGADGANASATWFQADHTHWAQVSATNFGAYYFGRAVNALFGPSNFSGANTYTTTSTAATTITAATESGATSTLTMGSNPWVAGQCVVVTGVTPAGYNSPAGQCWYVLTANATTLTFTNSVTGLGAGSVFGTVQAAQELDQDTLFEVLGGSAAGPSHIIQTCQGRDPNLTKLVMITNTNATPWTITSLVGETINGGATFTTPVASATNHPVIALKPILTSPSAAGCAWQASLQ